MAVAVKGQEYIHYRTRDQYRVVDMALHTETEEELVLYTLSNGTGPLFARPRGMFEEVVRTEGGELVERFTTAINAV